MKKIEAIDNKINFTAFGKSTINFRGKNKVVQKGVEASERKKLIERQTEKMEEEIVKIKSQKLGGVGSVFKRKELVNGPKNPVRNLPQ